MRDASVSRSATPLVSPRVRIRSCFCRPAMVRRSSRCSGVVAAASSARRVFIVQHLDRCGANMYGALLESLLQAVDEAAPPDTVEAVGDHLDHDYGVFLDSTTRRRPRPSRRRSKVCGDAAKLVDKLFARAVHRCGQRRSARRARRQQKLNHVHGSTVSPSPSLSASTPLARGRGDRSRAPCRGSLMLELAPPGKEIHGLRQPRRCAQGITRTNTSRAMLLFFPPRIS